MKHNSQFNLHDMDTQKGNRLYIETATLSDDSGNQHGSIFSVGGHLPKAKQGELKCESGTV